MCTLSQELFEHLQEDHDRIKGLVDYLREVSARKGPQALQKLKSNFSKLRDTLPRHLDAEEQVYYEALLTESDAREQALIQLEEHHVIRTIFGKLDELEPEDERWRPKLKVFKEILEHHIEEEESESFDSAEEVFDDAQLDEILKGLRAARDAWESR